MLLLYLVWDHILTDVESVLSGISDILQQCHTTEDAYDDRLHPSPWQLPPSLSPPDITSAAARWRAHQRVISMWQRKLMLERE